MTRRIRELTTLDYVAVLAINNAAVPAMNTLDADALDWLVTRASYARVSESSGTVRAFLIGLGRGTGYQSVNYQWFSGRYAEFLYVDRIAVANDARRTGHGTALYDDLVAFARDKSPRIVAEVNLNPPNPGSVAFHERHGFTGVGELSHAYDGAHAKRVLLMERPVR
jgi:hypothetical protein